MKYPTVTVLLPTYSEAGNIIPLIKELLLILPSNSEILVVDDQSPDGTAGLVQNFRNTRKAKNRVNILVRTKNHGLTDSLRDGIAASTGSIIVWMDADFSHPPAVTLKLIDAVLKGADLAVASRFLKTISNSKTPGNIDSGLQFALSRGLNSLVSRLFGVGLTDYTTGFLAVRRNVLNNLPLRGDYGEYCIDLLVRAKVAGYRIVEIAYTSPPRLYGKSKTAPNLPVLIRRGYGYLGTLLSLVWNIKISHVLKK